MLDTKALKSSIDLDVTPELRDVLMLDRTALQRATDHDLSHAQRSLLELNAFLQLPRSIGIDKLKESLSNVVRYMLELQGLDTGQGNQILCDDQHDSLSLNDNKPSAKKKRRQMEAEADLLKQLEEQMAKSFDQTYLHVEKKLDNVGSNIDIQLAKVDAEIDNLINDAAHDHGQKLESKRARRKRLKSFKKRVLNYQAEISLAAEAMDTAALIEIEQNLHQDHEVFNTTGAFPPEKPIDNIFNLFPRNPILRADPDLQWHPPKNPILAHDLLRVDLMLQNLIQDIEGALGGKGKGANNQPEMDV